MQRIRVNSIFSNTHVLRGKQPGMSTEEHQPARLHPVHIPTLSIKMSDPMDMQVVPAQRLQPVPPTELKVKGSDIILNPMQTIYSKNLMPCLDIIGQHTKIWYSRKPGAIARKLRQANALVNGLLSTITSMDSPEKMALHLHTALRNKSWSDIVRCIYTFKGASDKELQQVKNHRYELQNNLLDFLESLKNYYDVHTIPGSIISGINWDEFMKTSIQQVEAVEIGEDLEDPSEPAPSNPLVN